MLHALLLGVFVHAHECFWERMGPTSKLAEQFDVLACLLGKLLAQQRERDLPQTKFTKGLNEGRLMAKDHSGILLLIVACLRTTMGCRMWVNVPALRWKLTLWTGQCLSRPCCSGKCG